MEDTGNLKIHRGRLIIRRCHKCGGIFERSEEPKKCQKCGKSFLPFNYFSKVHAHTSQEYEKLYAHSEELHEGDMIKGIAALW